MLVILPSHEVYARTFQPRLAWVKPQPLYQSGLITGWYPGHMMNALKNRLATFLQVVQNNGVNRSAEHQRVHFEHCVFDW